MAFNDVESRMRYLESEMEGEKAVIRHVLRQASLNADDLGAIKNEVRAFKIEVSAEVRHCTEQMVLLNAALQAHGMRVTLLAQDVSLLRQDLTALRRDVEQIHVRLDRQDERIDALQAGMDTLRSGVGALRSDMDALRSDMDARFDAAHADTDALRANMDTKFDVLRTDMNAKFDIVLEAVRALAPRPST